MSDKPRILAFSAHAADFCSRSGATLAKYASHGSPVRIVDLTFGERGESGGLWRTRSGISIPDVKLIRRQEAEAAVIILGGEIRFLDWEDYPLVIDRQRIVQLAEEIREWRADIILTHWSNDPLNRDHSTTASAVLRACTVCAAPGLESRFAPLQPPRVFLFESGVPQTDFNQFRPDVYVDVTETFGTKLRALSELKAQQELSGWYTQYAEWRAWQARTYSGNESIKYAEAFKRFQPQVADWLH